MSCGLSTGQLQSELDGQREFSDRCHIQENSPLTCDTQAVAADSGVLLAHNTLEGKVESVAHNSAKLKQAAVHGVKAVGPEARAASKVLPSTTADVVGAVSNGRRARTGREAHEPKYPSEATKGTMQMVRFLP